MTCTRENIWQNHVAKPITAQEIIISRDLGTKMIWRL